MKRCIREWWNQLKCEWLTGHDMKPAHDVEDVCIALRCAKCGWIML